MSDSQAGPSIIEIFAGTLGIILSAVCIVGFFVAGFAIDYIDERIEDDCDSTTGPQGRSARLSARMRVSATREVPPGICWP